MKTHFICIPLFLLISGRQVLKSQITSWDQNPVPVYPAAGPGDNCGFGQGAFNNNFGVTSVGITAFGHRALTNEFSGNYNSAFGREAMVNNKSGSRNTAIGHNVLFMNSSGGPNADDNTGIGVQTLYSNSGGYQNTATGMLSMGNNTMGWNNTALGGWSLFSNGGTSGRYGHDNTAAGFESMRTNWDGFENVAVGNKALYSNVNGGYITALGNEALYKNNAHGNTAAGSQCMYENVSGFNNTAAGIETMYWNTTGDRNTALGNQALYNNNSRYNVAMGTWASFSNVSGTGNVACGLSTLYNSLGNYNTAIGSQAMQNVASSTSNSNTAIGYCALLDLNPGSQNTMIGAFADIGNPFTGVKTNCSCLGYGSITYDANRLMLGNATTWRVGGQVSLTSDGRFKFNVEEKDVKGLDFITRLKPVAYNVNTKKYHEFVSRGIPDSIIKKTNLDFTKTMGIRQSGFLAQEVDIAAKEAGYIFNGLAKPSNDEDFYTVSYSTFVVPLVKAVQEQQRMIEAQEALKTNLTQRLKSLADEMNGGKNTDLIIASAPVNSDEAELSFVKKDNVGDIRISFKATQKSVDYKLVVYNKSGKPLSGQIVSGQAGTSQLVSLSELQPGQYYYALLSSGKVVDMKKVTIQ